MEFRVYDFCKKWYVCVVVMFITSVLNDFGCLLYFVFHMRNLFFTSNFMYFLIGAIRLSSVFLGSIFLSAGQRRYVPLYDFSFIIVICT
jgi:hypothetical protein